GDKQTRTADICLAKAALYQLSYTPKWAIPALNQGPHPYQGKPFLSTNFFPVKEVIQPHVPVRLPCYDFTPVTSLTLGASLQKG
ncbi:unnamed protein product, partial [Scytosiphon promiscuus]